MITDVALKIALWLMITATILMAGLIVSREATQDKPTQLDRIEEKLDRLLEEGR